MHTRNAAFRVASISLLTVLFAARGAAAGAPEAQDTSTPRKDQPTTTRRDMPTVRRDVPTIRREVPTIRQEVPPIRREAPTTSSDVPAVRADATVRQDKPSSGQGTPASRVGQTTSLPAVRACMREVPNLLNYDLNIAGAILSKSNLSIGDVRTISSRTPKGTVIDQSPKAGSSVTCGTRVAVIVSEGLPVDTRQPPASTGSTCSVPDLTNRLLADVQPRLRGWSIGRVEKYQIRGQQEGTILRQSPTAGTSVKCGSSLDVVIAVAPLPERTPDCRVPDLVGQHVRQASQTLAAAGLTAGTAIRRLSVEPVDTVIGQSTTRGTIVLCGSRIDVAIATPPEVTPPPAPPAPPALVRVPALQGQDSDAARRTLDDVGLSLGAVERRTSAEPVGAVLDQVPAAGTQVRRGTPVQVWLSAGVPLSRVPDLRGRDRASAAEILGASQFRLGEVAERLADGASGSVVDQQPPAGTPARPGTAVRVWVAASARVPSVIGRLETDAAAILANQRLRVGTTQTRESAEARGTVIEQRPRPGEQARLNAPVDLVLARPITVIVPDLRSADRWAAAVTLTKVRLQLGESSYRESERPAGTVVEQSPQAGETVELGSPVQVWVAVPMRVAVPSVVGRQQPDALTMLTSGRLRIGSVQVRESAGPRGAILEQRPQAGERVEVGSAVDVVLASPVKVAVPDLRRSTPADSGRLLQARGLVLGTIGERVGTEFPGSIVDQQPGAGVRVDPGTPIAIWIAAPAPPVLIPPQVTPQLEVPDVTGRTRAEAQALLVGRGLALGQASTTTTSTGAPDTVVAQQPSVGSLVAPGTSVSVVIAVAPVLLSPPVAPVDPVTVPSTSGMPLIWLLLGVALGAVGAGVAVKARVHGSHALPPSITLAPHPDMRAEVALTSNGPLTRSELSLQPFPDAGHQTVSGPRGFGVFEVTEVR